MGAEIIIIICVAGGATILGGGALIASIATCVHVRKKSNFTSHDKASITVDNKVVKKMNPDGTKVLEKEQHIKIDKVDFDQFKQDYTYHKTIDNQTANIVGGGAVNALNGLIPSDPSKLADIAGAAGGVVTTVVSKKGSPTGKDGETTTTRSVYVPPEPELEEGESLGYGYHTQDDSEASIIIIPSKHRLKKKKKHKNKEKQKENDEYLVDDDDDQPLERKSQRKKTLEKQKSKKETNSENETEIEEDSITTVREVDRETKSAPKKKKMQFQDKLKFKFLSKSEGEEGESSKSIFSILKKSKDKKSKDKKIKMTADDIDGLADDETEIKSIDLRSQSTKDTVINSTNYIHESQLAGEGETTATETD